MESLHYAVVYIGDDDKTHFRDEQIPWKQIPASVPENQLYATPFQDATKLGFMRMPAGQHSDWHPAPRKQFILVLNGCTEIEVGDGQRRTFTAGSVFLVTDVEGKGHRTSALGDEPVLTAWVPIP